MLTPLCIGIVAKKGKNQWGEFTIQNVDQVPYGHETSTVFGLMKRRGHLANYDEDEDPILKHLRMLDYRYIRFCFHPLIDKFVSFDNWRDPQWANLKSIRTGLDSDERHRRFQVFGTNQIHVQQKSIPQLLVDEVSIDGHC